MALRILKKKTLLALAENAIKGGDNYFFRNVYATDESGIERDILEDGQLSCAVFVSQILLPIELIKTSHATVAGMERDMLACGWQQIPTLRPGAVIVWAKIQDESETHAHIGFCVSESEAISNSTSQRFPRRHSINYDGSRPVEKIYWHPELDNG